MNEQLEDLKDEVRMFQRQQKSLLWGLFTKEETQAAAPSINDSNKTSLIKRNNMIDDNEFKPEFFKKDLTNKELDRRQKTNAEKLAEQ